MLDYKLLCNCSLVAVCATDRSSCGCRLTMLPFFICLLMLVVGNVPCLSFTCFTAALVAYPPVCLSQLVCTFPGLTAAGQMCCHCCTVKYMSRVMHDLMNGGHVTSATRLGLGVQQPSTPLLQCALPCILLCVSCSSLLQSLHLWLHCVCCFCCPA